MITFKDFQKLDLRVAEIISAEEVEGADKLLRLTLAVGELGERVIVSSIKPWYSPNDLIGKKIVYLANLEPKIIHGIESVGMLLAAESEDQANCVLLILDKDVPSGIKIR